MTICKACEDRFDWNDDVIRVEDDVYHKDCVTLYPTGYFVMLDDEPLGESENDDGESACDIFPELLDGEDE